LDLFHSQLILAAERPLIEYRNRNCKNVYLRPVDTGEQQVRSFAATEERFLDDYEGYGVA
jgi:hypothetical protein